MAYIGEKEIKGFTAIDSGSFVEVELVDGFKTKMSGTLFYHLQTEEKGTGSITDNVNHYFAKKFVSELAEHDLEFYMIQNVGVAMHTLGHNLREIAISKVFDCKGGDSMSIQKLIPAEAQELVEPQQNT